MIENIKLWLIRALLKKIICGVTDTYIILI